MNHIVLRNRVHHRARGVIPGCKPADTTAAVIADRALGIRPGLNPLQAHRDWCDSEYGSTFDGEVRTYRTYATFNPTLRD